MWIALGARCRKENWNHISQAILATGQKRSSLQARGLFHTASFSSRSYRTSNDWSLFQHIQDYGKALPVHNTHHREQPVRRGLGPGWLHLQRPLQKPPTPLPDWALSVSEWLWNKERWKRNTALVCGYLPSSRVWRNMQLLCVSTDYGQSNFPSPSPTEKKQERKWKQYRSVNNAYSLQSTALPAREK